MAKKNPSDPERIPEEYYKLKTEAVEDLASADESNSPEVSEEELEKYGARRKGWMPHWLKMCLVKFWFPAAVCYFFFWGLSGYVTSMTDLMFVTAIVLGMITDLLTNNALRSMADEEGGNDSWMMYPKKGMASFFLNILHGFVVLFLVMCIYAGINKAAIALTGAAEDSVPLGVEPILFGVFYLLCDLALIAGKNFLTRRQSATNQKV